MKPEKTKPLKRINTEQQLYLFPTPNGGYSCLGFEVAEQRRLAVSAWCGLPYEAFPVGTIEHLREYEKTMEFGAANTLATGERCDVELTPQLIGLEGKRVEVVNADGSVHRFWVGKSTGWMPCHLALANTRSSGGECVTGAPFRRITVVREHK